MAAALEAPDLIIAPSGNHRSGARILTEELFSNIRAIFCLEGLEVTIGGAVHQLDERTIAILREELIPFPSPYDLEDIPSCASEERFEFLDDLAVSTDRAIESLQIAVDHEDEVVESFTRCERKGRY